jgi:hypothetical protein
MYMADRKDRGGIITTNFLLTVVMTLLLAYLALMQNNISSQLTRINTKIDQNFSFIIEMRDKLMAHLGWHEGRGEK